VKIVIIIDTKICRKTTMIMDFLQILVSIITIVLGLYFDNIILRYYVCCEVMLCLYFVRVVYVS